MNITVVGTGYVGLVTGTCFSEMGNKVTCIDIDQKKVNKLKEGIIPIYEPGLEPLVKKNYSLGTLDFSTNIADGLKDSADLQYVLAVASDIGKNMTAPLVVVDKSTVPIGTADKVKAAIQSELDKRGAVIEFSVVF